MRRRAPALTAAGAAVVGLVLVLSIAVRVALGSMPETSDAAVGTAGAALLGVGAAAVLLLHGAERATFRRALLVAAGGLLVLAAGVLLARVPFIPRGEAAYVPLGSPQLVSPLLGMAAELVLAPALAVAGASAVLTALIGALAAGARRLRARGSG